MIKRHPRAVHEGKIKATEFAILIAFERIIQNAACLKRTAEAADEKKRHLGRVVSAA